MAIDGDDAPIEVLTTTKISINNILSVIMSFDDYVYITVHLNIKKKLGQLIDPKDEEDMQNFLNIQRILDKYGFKLIVNKDSGVVKWLN